MFCQQAKPRGGAQTNLCDGKGLVAGDSHPAPKFQFLWVVHPLHKALRFLVYNLYMKFPREFGLGDWLILSVLIIGIGITVTFYYLETQKNVTLTQLNTVFAEENTDLTKQLSESKNTVISLQKTVNILGEKINIYAAKEAQTATRLKSEQAQAKIVVTSPKSGSRFCLGKDISIQWQAPSDMESVTAYLIYSGLDGIPIGTYSASSNELGKQDGTGDVVFTIPNDVSWARDGLTLKVNGLYKNTWLVSNAAGSFGIDQCQG
jgi:hypothetical protein